MTFPANEEVVEQVNSIGSTPWTGKAYRHTASRRDPFSGAGARLFGGRWNPRGIVPAIYLAVPESTCMGELERAAESQGSDVEAFLAAPRIFHRFDVAGLEVLDLRSQERLESVGLTMEDIQGDDWEACQLVGHAAWFLNFSGVLAPSAYGSGYVLTVFEDRIGPGVLDVVDSEPLDVSLYRALK